MTGPHFLLLLLGGLWLQPARAGSHTCHFSRSSLSGPLPGVPQFSSVGYVDGVRFISYTSESHMAEPRAPWIERITMEDIHYLDTCTNVNQGAEQVHRDDVRNAMGQSNQTEGVHVYQVMFGCELWDNGSIGGFRQDTFDGHDFISFEKDRLVFTAAMDAARITQDLWNSDRSICRYWKEYLEGTCIEYLKKYLKLGEERLQTVAPETMVTRRKNGDRTFLTGYAYGFYPREIEVKWVRNGVEIPWESRDILPHHDGTYQVRTTVEVQEGDDEKTYRYEVYHSSLPDTVTVMYEEKSPPVWVVIGGVIGALVGVGTLGAVVWVVYSKKNTSGKSTYTVANKDPPTTDSSSS
ncbi:patr class I histocompatibility antigen, A-126 alpha chain-like [Pleurodeles waltl]|uniref:patr class I histocompatibility antigen, A-126 alpha chain-like n=1 Tax=Pleurodeles waltl TaxID=8319 RepID=UPI0037098187